MEEGHHLTEEEVSNCLSNLGVSATGLAHVYLSLSIPERNLKDVSILSSYCHLQKLEVPYNKIKDLSCVSHMPHLVLLDASHNHISDFFGFQPPKNLKEVNFSHNQMSQMKDLSTYLSLRKLNLDYNFLTEIQGLENCICLTHLSLAHNMLSKISGLDNLPLKELCLRGNQIQKIENVQNLWTLQTLDLSWNKIQSLSGLQNLNLLGVINLEGNLVREIKEVTHIHDLSLLRDLNLQRNPVQDQPDYRLAVIFLLQQLSSLDQLEVTPEEKVSAMNKYDPPAEIITGRDHMMQVVYQLMQPQVMYDSTLPSLEAPYPMLVLTGPQACGKRELAHKLCLEFSQFFAYGACHTTRSPYFGEMDGSDYHYVSEEVFQDMVHMGKFIQTMQYGGHQYGLSRDTIEGVAREGLACCVHMELEGVCSLKKTYFEPRYILLIPTDRKEYGRRLSRRGLYSHAQMDHAASRIDIYIKVNREQPGYFDNVIPCDDTEEAFKALSQVVREYLGLDEQSGGDDSITTPSNAVTGVTGDSLVAEHTTDPCDPNTRHFYSQVQAKMARERTSAEKSSTQRRQQLIQEALMGRSPSVYAQLFNWRSVPTSPNHLDSTAPAASLGHQEDRSSQESIPCSALTMGSSAGVSGALSPEDMGAKVDEEPLGDHKQALEGTLVPSDGTGLDARPVPLDWVSPQAGRMPARPGSNAKPVLPTISSGRRTTKGPLREFPSPNQEGGVES